MNVKSFAAIAASLLCLQLGACDADPPPKPAWRALLTDAPEALLSITGTAPDDVWAVGSDKGHGPLVLHFDGVQWSRKDVGHRGDLWWAQAVGDRVYVAGAAGAILSIEQGVARRIPTPGSGAHTVFGLWADSPTNVYAVGSVAGRGGFIWRNTGDGFQVLPIPWERLPRFVDGEVPGFFKVWGSANGEVFVVGDRGVMLRSSGGAPFEVITGGSEERLFTVHGAGGKVMAVGGSGAGVVLELGADGRFEPRSPDACPLLQGLAVGAEGEAWASGFKGEVYRRSGAGWTREAHGLDVKAESLHATWIDSDGGVWMVGGNVLSGGLDQGTVLYRGAREPSLVGNLAQVPKPDAAVCPEEEIDPAPSRSIAMRWNAQLLGSIRRDLPRPTVHARNLFHLSAAMWDAWAAYDARAQGVFFKEKHTAPDVEAARHEALSHAAYRLLRHRYGRAVGAEFSLRCYDAFMDRLGLTRIEPDTSGDSPRAIGNRIAALIIESGLTDGANEQHDYADTTGWSSVNRPLVVDEAFMRPEDPSRWTPLNLAISVTQNGIPIGAGVQSYIGAHWGRVTPFALDRAEEGRPYFVVAEPPVFGPAVRREVVEVLRASRDLGSDALMDISPGALGGNTPGANDGTGHALNPATGRPYAPVHVRRGDFGRIVAEYWADGPHSETPPGHWNVIANHVADSEHFERRLFGVGDPLAPLEWDVKVYLALNGAEHDAAIAAWELKRIHDSARPISLIRYMGMLGQSSDPAGPSYHPEGLPLEPGLIEVITAESSAPGARHAHLARFQGQVAVRSWRGEPGDTVNDLGGIGWIRAVEWMPYQLRTFVTPAFPGFVSGHSTFSGAGAEALTALTGSAYFPGGIAEFVARRDSFLRFERGPETDVHLQWATYLDAADQAGQSRLWGGIHIEVDDLVGRRVGLEVGKGAIRLAQRHFGGSPNP